jgi:hypothetical protein
MGFDEVLPCRGAQRVAPGCAVLCGARAARGSKPSLAPVRQNNNAVHLIASTETTYLTVVYSNADAEGRRIFQPENAAFAGGRSLPVYPAQAARIEGACGNLHRRFRWNKPKGKETPCPPEES